MNKKINRLRGYIMLKLPYRVITATVIGFTVFLLVLFGILCAFCVVDVEAVPYVNGNTTDYMYIDFNDYYPTTVEGYYFIEDNDYIYVYYDDQMTDLSTITRVQGVPMPIDDDVLEKMLPDFQKAYQYIDDVHNIDDMTDYTGLYALDATAPSYVFEIGFLAILIVLELCVFIGLGIYIYYARHKFQKDLEKIVLRNEHEMIIQGLYHPKHCYNSLKVALLDDYLVCNHPYPFAIRYDDIAWIYIDKKLWFLSLDSDLRIFIYDRNYRKKKILVSASLWKKNKQNIEDLFVQLPKMNPQILVGYNDDNIQKFEQIKHGLK